MPFKSRLPQFKTNQKLRKIQIMLLCLILFAENHLSLLKFCRRNTAVLLHPVMRKNIKDDDFLGRAVFSSRRAARAALKGCIAHDIFLEKEDRSLSVDRFGFCSKQKLTDIQNQNAELRSKKFYGWAKLQALTARGSGRKVQSTPAENNPCHADIILPEAIEKDEKIAHAKELASNSEWEAGFTET